MYCPNSLWNILALAVALTYVIGGLQVQSIHVKKRNSYTVLYNKAGMLLFGLILQYFCIKWHPMVQKLIIIVTARFKEDIPIFSVRKSDEYVINV